MESSIYDAETDIRQLKAFVIESRQDNERRKNEILQLHSKISAFTERVIKLSERFTELQSKLLNDFGDLTVKKVDSSFSGRLPLNDKQKIGKSKNKDNSKKLGYQQTSSSGCLVTFSAHLSSETDGYNDYEVGK